MTQREVERAVTLGILKAIGVLLLLALGGLALKAGYDKWQAEREYTTNRY